MADAVTPPESEDASARDSSAGEASAHQELDDGGEERVDGVPVEAANDALAGDHDAATGPARPVMNRSCQGLAPTCGADGATDCCASSIVPGGTFNRSNDPMSPATVSDFRLDRYEVTVGRFRRFVAEYPANQPIAGSGRNPSDATDTGWAPAWPLPVDQAALIRQIKLDQATWRDTPNGTENLPINSITWFVGFAFCIWDGGRMPTEAEWNYAAAGGSEQRYYPWSSPPESTTVDPTYAVFNTYGLVPPVSPVGSRSPRGDGRWGHADLAGNLWEFTRDQIDATFSYVTPCVDCTNPQPVDLTPLSLPGDAIRGGGFFHNFNDIWTGKRSNIPPTSPEGDIGIRCARLP